ncbi:hypothetical protein QTG56_06835 [Rossellomorea sp. AcN35-11]|nr:hypothetical protein [Rossellomorea aquimaris]WJV30735.1 hypothetical protein QTG56_06835 [Rossellomorea sp. AcN35-11]
MVDQNKRGNVSQSSHKGSCKTGFTGGYIWIRLQPNSNLVISTKNNGKQRVIYYSQACFHKEDIGI